jgi:hypothetical protein
MEKTGATKQKTEVVYDIDTAIDLIVNSDNELKRRWDAHLKAEYGDNPDPSIRLVYTDIGEICRFIVEKKKVNETESFETIFLNIENILNNCDKRTKDLITVGLFEGIHNIGGTEIDYHYGFNKWLYTLTAEQWRAVIDFWEGKEWRTTRKPK